MEVKFMKCFVDEMDRRLAPYYNSYTERIDYLTFLAYMEKSMYSKKGKEIGVAFFEQNKIRQLFGKKQIKGIRKWKLDLIIDSLVKTNIIIRTEYSRLLGKTRRYTRNRNLRGISALNDRE